MKTIDTSISSSGETLHAFAAKPRQAGWIFAGRSRAAASIVSRVAAALLAFSAVGHAALIDMTAGNVDGSPMLATSGSSVYVPITTSGLSDVGSLQFSLKWDSLVLQYVSAEVNASDFILGTAFSFDVDTPAELGVGWSSTSGGTGSGSGTIYTIEFSVLGGIGTTSDVLFWNSPAPMEITDEDLITIGDVSWHSGKVNVVPEPVNCALAVVASLAVALGAGRVVRRRFFQNC